MGMATAQFYALTYQELRLILEGRAARCKRDMKTRREESAWLAQWFLLPHKKPGSDPVTPDQLMGRKPREQRGRRFADMEESASAWFAAYGAKSNQRLLTDGK
jgi:hypothetical protein